MKKRIKLVVLHIVFFIVISASSAYAAILYNSADVSFDNTNTGIESNTVQGALDELFERFTSGKLTYVAPQSGDTHKGIVYLDPTDLSKYCDASNSVSTTETKTGCMKWYIYDDSGNNYKMILDHNTTATIKWNDSNSNVAYEQSNLYPIVQDLKTTSGWVVEPRLISAEEVNIITGKTGWTNTSSWYCLESKVQDSSSNPYCNNTGKFGWLYDYTYCVEGAYNWKCPNNDTTTIGYWTSTTRGNPGSGSYGWRVLREGYLSTGGANYTNSGVRPVITISKSLFNN